MTTTIPRTSAMVSFTASFISLSRCEPGTAHRPDLGPTLTHEAPKRVALPAREPAEGGTGAFRPAGRNDPGLSRGRRAKSHAPPAGMSGAFECARDGAQPEHGK